MKIIKILLVSLVLYLIVSCSNVQEGPSSELYRVFYTQLDKSKDIFIQAEYFVSSENTASGEDGVYGTGDDDINYYWVFHCVENTNCGRYEKAVSFEMAGDDGVWFTDDDSPDIYIIYTYESDQRIEQTYYEGVDGQLFTNDDEQSSVYRVSIVSEGKSEFRDYSIGQDELLGSEDDIVRNYVVYTEGEFNLTSKLTYGDPGEDGIWFTTDDVLFNEPTEADNGIFYPSYFFGQEERQDGDETVDRYVKRIPGPDKIQNTADDEIIEVYEFSKVKENSGFVLGQDFLQLKWDKQGPDGIWETEDDQISYRCSYTISGAMKTKESKKTVCYSNAGPDLIEFSGDETIEVYSTETYMEDESGNIYRTEINFTGHGQDGIWFSSDDVSPMTTIRIHEVKHN